MSAGCYDGKPDAKGMWPMLCAWCLAEGRRTVVGRCSVPRSSGICKVHEREMEEETARLRPLGYAVARREHGQKEQEREGVSPG